MTTNQLQTYGSETKSAPEIPFELRAIFAQRPLLSTENVHVYDRFLDQVIREMAPQTAIEWLWVKDYYDGSWEILRLRRAKTLIIDNTIGRALQSMLAPVLRDEPGHLVGILDTRLCDGIAATWYEGPEGKAKITELLKRHGLTMDHVHAQALMLRAGDIERIDRMVASLERRRNDVLRELDMHREFARRLQGKTAEVIDQIPLVPA